jgi:hypothetical protein
MPALSAAVLTRLLACTSLSAATCLRTIRVCADVARSAAVSCVAAVARSSVVRTIQFIDRFVIR